MNEQRQIAITGCLKATPVTEGDKRFVFIEASNESVDAQGEIVLAKALKESAPYYLKFGNIDLDHITQVGARAGIPDYHFFEIGLPTQVEVNGKRTFVKASVYRGDGKSAKRANEFWSSLTEQEPAQRWFPSVGGAVLNREDGIDKQGKIKMVSRVRWTNVGFSKTPVNQDVAGVSTLPIGAFAKSWDGDSFDLRKALTAGYGTDSATLTGGGALRQQSLDGAPLNYWDFRNKISGDVREKRVKEPGAQALAQWAIDRYGMGASLASEWVDRFMADLSLNLKQARNAS